MAQKKLTLRIDLDTPFGIKAVRAARKAVYSLASEWGFSEQALREIELSFSEALQNAMEHGASASGSVSTFTIVSDQGIRIVIEDPGAGSGDCENLKAIFGIRICLRRSNIKTTRVIYNLHYRSI